MQDIVRAPARFSACAVAGLMLLMPVVPIVQQAISLDEAVQIALARSPALDILVRQSAADQTNTDVITTRYDYIIARAALEGILGREL